MSLAQLWVEFRASTDKFADDLAQISRNVRDFDKELKPVTDRLKDLGNAATEMGKMLTIGLTAPIAAVGALGLSFNAFEEQAQVAFTGLLGSGERARAFLEDMKDFAARTPFEFPDLVTASRRLLAMGFSAADVKPTMTAIGDAMAGLGQGPDVMDRVVRALGQMQTGGKVVTREMNELTMAGISAWQILAQGIPAAHGSTAALRKLVEEGLVPADEAIKILVAGMEDQFQDAMANQSRTALGLLSTIRDESKIIAGELTQGLFETIKGPITSLTDGMTVFANSLKGWSNEAKAAVTVFALLAAAAGPVLFIFGQFILTITQLVSQFGRLFLFITGIAPTLADIGAAFGLIVEAFASGGFVAGISAFLELFGVLGAVAAGFATVGAAIAGLGLLELAARLLGVKDQFHGLLGDLVDFGLALAGLVGRVITVSVKFVITEGAAIWNWFMGTTVGNALGTFAKNSLQSARDTVQAATAVINGGGGAAGAGGDYGPSLDLAYYGPGADLVAKQKKINEAAAAAAEEWAKAAKKVQDAFVDTLKPADDLNEKIAMLRARFSDSDIVTMYADKIMQAAHAQREHGYEVRGATAELEESSRQLEVARGKIMDLAAALDYISGKPPIALMYPAPSQIPLINLGDVPSLPSLPKTGTTAINDRVFDRAKDQAAVAIGAYNEALKKQQEEWRQMGQRVIDGWINDMSRLFIDGLIHGKNFWESFKSLGTNAFSSMFDQVMQHFFHKLLDPMATALGHLMDNITNMMLKGVKSIIGAFSEGLASKFGSFFGLGNDSVIKNVAGGASSAAGSAGGIAGIAGSVAGAGVSSALSAVTGLAGVAVGIGGIFQQKRLEGTMNAVEYNTRASLLTLEGTLHLVLEPWRAEFQEYKSLATYFLQYIAERMDPLIAAVGPSLGPAAGASMTAAGAAQAGSTIIGGPQTTINLNFSEKVDSQEIKTSILPTIIDALNDNYNSYLEKLVQILNNSSGGVVTSRVTA